MSLKHNETKQSSYMMKFQIGFKEKPRETCEEFLVNKNVNFELNSSSLQIKQISQFRAINYVVYLNLAKVIKMEWHKPRTRNKGRES